MPDFTKFGDDYKRGWVSFVYDPDLKCPLPKGMQQLRWSAGWAAAWCYYSNK